jgi:hypothetical protein
MNTLKNNQLSSFFVLSLTIFLFCSGFYLKTNQKSKDIPDLCKLYGSVYIEDSPSFADYRVYVDNVEGFADILVYKEANPGLATSSGIWHITDARGFADFTIYLDQSRGFADFAICYTPNRGFAGCRNR